MEGSILLPRNLRGRSIHFKVIPTVCNLKNLINKLKLTNGDIKNLKQWEKRSYQAYLIENIKHEVLYSSQEEAIEIIKRNILDNHPNELGASCIDIYLVAFVAQTYGTGKKKFFDYIIKNGITEKVNSAQAIWQVGKGDGVFLGILNRDGSIKDWEFFEKWVKGERLN